MAVPLRKPAAAAAQVSNLLRGRGVPSSSNCHGRIFYSAAELVSLDQVQRERGGRKRLWGEQVLLPDGSSLPLSRLHNSSPNRSVHHSPRQVPFLLPHFSPLPHLQERLQPLGPNRIKVLTLVVVRAPSLSSSRGLCSIANEGADSDGENYADGVDGYDESGNGCLEVESTADPEEVNRVCRVIEELFALDRNMEAVLDECGINLTHDLVVEVLERFRHARKPAFRFFCWAGERPGFEHDSRTYNSMMSILASARQFETMVSMLEEMGEKKVLTMDAFTIAMKAFAAAKERKKAVGIFELMKRYKYKVGVHTINLLLDGLGRAKLGKEAQVLFGKLEGRFTPNLKTYTVLLNGWCRVKNLMEAGRVWNVMIDKGFKPDIVAYNTMLEGLLRCQKRSDAIKFFEVMKAKGPLPDVQSYTILIRDLCKQRRMEEAIEYFDEMVDSGCQPDAAIYTCLLTGFGNLKKIDRVYELLMEMKEKGCPPDGRTYNALIKLMTSQRLPDEAARIYKKMIKSGIEPSIHTYNMLLKSYFQIRDYEMGCAVWDEMSKKGLCPDDNSYTVFIGGLIRQGRSLEACKYLEEMIEKGMKTPHLDYNKFAADFSRAGKPDILEDLALKMKFYGKLEVSSVFAGWAETMKKRVKRIDPVGRLGTRLV